MFHDGAFGISILLSSAGAALLLAAAAGDVAHRLIPNRIPLAIALCGLALRLADGTLAPALCAAGAVFLGGLAAWRAGLLGGGDVKILAAASLFVAPLKVPVLLAAVALAGGVLALLYLALRYLLPPTAPAPRAPRLRRLLRIEAWRIRRGAPLPYATAIAVGTLFTIWR